MDCCGWNSSRTAWPLLRGWMSMKASVLSLSKSLKDGISPGGASAGILPCACLHVEDLLSRGTERRLGGVGDIATCP